MHKVSIYTDKLCIIPMICSFERGDETSVSLKGGNSVTYLNIC
jgi:hypothetical protein